MNGRQKITPVELLKNTCVDTFDLVKRVIPDSEMPILKVFLKSHIAYLEENLQKTDEGLPIIGTHFAFPNEVFRAFDVATIIFEATPYFLSALLPNGSEPWYDSANYYGHPYHTCTAQKGVLGMVLEDHLKLDVIVTPTGPCDNNVSTYQYYSNQRKIPLVIADFPTSRYDERGFTYYAEELKQVVEEVGKAIGQEPDWDRLKQAVKINTESLEYLNKLNELRRIKPCPVESLANPLITGAQAFLAGHPEKVRFCKDVLDIVQKRVKYNITTPGEEKFRAVWPYMSIFFNIGFSEWMDRELGMTQLVDIFNQPFLEPSYSEDIDEIFLDLAKQNMNFPMVRQSEYFMDYMVNDFIYAAKYYDADCAVFTAHIGCKQSVSGIQILRETFQDELGIPMLTLELDVGDKRFTSIETVKHELTEFTKTLL
ncbi:MAG: 2-hydroxyacyl-CoA dehydratase [Candidatus Hodarchaeota archaeon]